MAQINAPAMAQNMPLVRPAWRPTRLIWSEAGMVASAPPATQQVTGSVASAIRGASASPASPLIAMSVELFVKSMAWQAASSPTLRWVLVFCTVTALESIESIVGPGCHGQRRQERNHLYARGALLHAGALRDRSARVVR